MQETGKVRFETISWSGHTARSAWRTTAISTAWRERKRRERVRGGGRVFAYKTFLCYCGRIVIVFLHHRRGLATSCETCNRGRESWLTYVTRRRRLESGGVLGESLRPGEVRTRELRSCDVCSFVSRLGIMMNRACLCIYVILRAFVHREHFVYSDTKRILNDYIVAITEIVSVSPMISFLIWETSVRDRGCITLLSVTWLAINRI